MNQYSRSTNITINNTATEKSLTIMLFDLSIYGHHANYIKHLIEYWRTQQLAGSLKIVVSPQFMEVHSDVVKLSNTNQQNKQIEFIPITQEEENALKPRDSGISRNRRYFQEWDLLCKYARFIQATHCLIMYFDTCCLPMAFGKTAPCPVSGIYFKPTFHYSTFAGDSPSLKERLQRLREKFILARVLHHPQLNTLLSLDPFVIKYIDQYKTNVQAYHLADPVEQFRIEKPQPDLKTRMGVDIERKVFLLFGSFEAHRKGVYQILEAVNILSDSICEKICLMFIGNADATEVSHIKAQVTATCQGKPIQIITRFEYISDSDISKYFQVADIVLAPYQKHIGMSGILLLAAAAKKPVLSSNYGLMGEMVRRYKLGLAVDSTNKDQLALSINQCLLTPPEVLCDLEKIESFALSNSAQEFAKKIFQHIN